MRRNRMAKLLFLLALVLPQTVSACSVCFGDPSSPWAKALGLGILALLGVVLLVLGGIVAFFVFMAKRARMIEMNTPKELQP